MTSGRDEHPIHGLQQSCSSREQSNVGGAMFAAMHRSNYSGLEQNRNTLMYGRVPSLLERTATVAASRATASAIKDDAQPVVMNMAPLPMILVAPYSPQRSMVADGLSMTTQAADDAPCFFRKPPSENIMISLSIQLPFTSENQEISLHRSIASFANLSAN